MSSGMLEHRQRTGESPLNVVFSGLHPALPGGLASLLLSGSFSHRQDHKYSGAVFRLRGDGAIVCDKCEEVFGGWVLNCDH